METARLIKGTPDLHLENGSILIIQLGDIGDVVLTLPFVEALSKAFPRRSLVLCVREHARELMEDCPQVYQVLSVNKQKRTFKTEMVHQGRFLRDLRRSKCTMAIELRTGTRGAMIAMLSGAHTRVARYANDGTLWRNRFFTHLVKPTREYCQYAAQHNLNIMAPFGLFEEDPRPHILVSEQRRRKAKTIFQKAGIPEDRPLVAVHPFSLWKYKEWTPSEMASLLDRIQAEYRCNMIVTGAPNERKQAGDLIDICQCKPYNLAGETSIGQLPAVLAACTLFIGVDTAALHIAAAVGVPTVGIFGPSSWTSWAPRGQNHLVVKKGLSCQPCSRKGCEGSEWSRCLEALTAKEVYEAVEKTLNLTLTGEEDRR
ncbi:putative lipopolysaccharide heptosyltransferase III [delta proteobacterium NaphS2]|nr:putative lipopolysaccharide heptosyltransferase III [delta proteobacterium NaphS2]